MTPRPAPLQNRVLPTGEVISHPARGMFTGNRGILHRPDGTLGISRWRHPHWLVCALEHPRGTYHGPMPDRGWSALFFLDEAVALSAGHRPCHECRRAAYRDWVAAWSRASAAPFDRKVMDRTLHTARVTRQRAQIRHQATAESLPDGAFILWQDRAHLILGDAILPYAPEGYGTPLPRPTGRVTVLTPRPSVATLAAGFTPVLHPSANAELTRP